MGKFNHGTHQTHERDSRKQEGDVRFGGCFFASVRVFRGSSNHCQEFQETVNKSKSMLKAVALAETFANCRRTKCGKYPDQG
jgi:hypothetical protein